MEREEVKRAAGHIEALRRLGHYEQAENLKKSLVEIGADEEELEKLAHAA